MDSVQNCNSYINIPSLQTYILSVGSFMTLAVTKWLDE
jgi:hypothetical protein